MAREKAVMASVYNFRFRRANPFSYCAENAFSSCSIALSNTIRASSNLFK
jgi:hypothetical protein